jgi:ligand-binding sensor domain-containing protein
LDPATPLANYGRQAWNTENGLPQNTVQALLQTRQGYMWLGTEAGLVRFDGSGFAVFNRTSTPALPDSHISCLLEDRRGALWIGTRDGLARWKEDAFTVFGTANGLPGNGIRAVAEAANGILWVWTDQGLARLTDQDRFVAATAETGLPASAITAVTTDGEGVVWVTTQESAARYMEGHWSEPLLQQQLAPVFPKDGAEFIQAFPGGVAAATEKTVEVLHGDLVVAQLSVGKELPGSRIQVLLVDRAGSLWIGTNGGLARLEGDRVQRLPVIDPLASASVLALLEDREGNLWAGTENSGLHILRDQRFRIWGMQDGLSSDRTTAVVEDGAGNLWVGTSERGLNALHRSGAGSDRKTGTETVKTYSTLNGLLSDVILSLAVSSNGDVWVGTPDGLNRIRGSVIASLTSADGLPDDSIRSLLADADGSLWIGTRHGLTHLTGELGGVPSGLHLETFTQANGLGSDLVGAMARDSNGDLWVATLAGLSRLRADGKITNYTIADGLASNAITALSPGENGILAVGTQVHGWNLWDGWTFSTLIHDESGQTAIHAILDEGGLNDINRHLWFATGNGIARCDCTGMSGTGQTPDCSQWIEFGVADGLRSRETASNSYPSAWRSRDGHLWFATPKGLVEVDPAHFPANTAPPPVTLERFTVDDVDEPLRGAASFTSVQAGHAHFQFDYAGLSFVAPQKVRYRYMLEGFDRGWIEAGTRRTVYYTNIPPGRYTFHVQAANNDGIWNTVGAALAFELRPHFYRTKWFYSMVVTPLAGITFLVPRRRRRRAVRGFRVVLGDLDHIAREIHGYARAELRRRLRAVGGACGATAIKQRGGRDKIS